MIIKSKYNPLPPQIKAHSCVQENLLYLAGIGGGKTCFGVHEMWAMAIKNPEVDGFIGAPTYPMVRDVIISALEEWMPKELWRWKKGDNQIELWTGRKWFLGTATHPDRARGKNVGYAWIDEPAMIPSRKMWDIVKGRIRDPRTNKYRMIATTTPRGFNWLVNIFLKGDKKSHFVVRSKTRDNIYLRPDFEPGLRALYGDDFAEQELDAIIKQLQGLVFQYSANVHSRFSIGEMRGMTKYYIGGGDWGYTNPACLIVAGVDHDERLMLIDIWYRRGAKRGEIAEQARFFRDKYGVKVWYMDHDPEGVRCMREKGCTVILAEKEVIPGVQYTSSLFQVRGDGLPRIMVAANLKDWLREQNGYQYPPQDPDGPPKEKDEIPIGNKGDHAMDATRYLAYTHSLKNIKTEYETVGSHRNWDAVN